MDDQPVQNPDPNAGGDANVPPVPAAPAPDAGGDTSVPPAPAPADEPAGDGQPPAAV